ncbi:MAG: hypothetical protein JSS87_01140 [Acidobacteria bacterium]|nr:hypothetical protein [Acidobacteriota bacterium]
MVLRRFAVPFLIAISLGGVPKASWAGVAPAKVEAGAAAVTDDQGASAKKDNNEDDDEERKKHNDEPIKPEQLHHPVLWHDPSEISSLDLFYGQGGKKGQPVPPFRFIEEDHNHSTPKMDVRDARGKKWRAKLGHEARPEVVASRLLWAVGYFANDDYVLPKATIEGIHMRRGRQYIHGEEVENVRFARKPNGQKKIAIWRWRENPFAGTREWNGLRVMMAVLNSWDLKDDNNYVYSDRKNDREIFLVSDVGTAFGRTGLHFTNAPSKDNVQAYIHSKFITKVTDKTVSFATPAPSYSLLFETLGIAMKQFFKRQGMLWIGKDIPCEDARWIGGLLGQLSHQQLVDAFRAGNYPPDEVELFVSEVEKRIAALKKL